MLSSRERKEARKLHTTETRKSVSTLMVIQCTFMFTRALLGWKGQCICCVTRGRGRGGWREGGREGGRER